MLSLLFHPFLPVPFAPSLIGLLTTNALLISALLTLALVVPPLRIMRYRKQRVQFLFISLAVFAAGLIAISFWGTPAELPMALIWSAIYIGVLLGLVFLIYKICCVLLTIR